MKDWFGGGAVNGQRIHSKGFKKWLTIRYLLYIMFLQPRVQEMSNLREKAESQGLQWLSVVPWIIVIIWPWLSPRPSKVTNMYIYFHENEWQHRWQPQFKSSFLVDVPINCDQQTCFRLDKLRLQRKHDEMTNVGWWSWGVHEVPLRILPMKFVECWNVKISFSKV